MKRMLSPLFLLLLFVSIQFGADAQESSAEELDSGFIAMALANSKFWEVNERFTEEAAGQGNSFAVVVKVSSRLRNESYILSEVRETGLRSYSLRRGMLTMAGSLESAPRFEFAYFPVDENDVKTEMPLLSTLVSKIEEAGLPKMPKLAADGFTVELRGVIDGVEILTSGWFASFDESCGPFWDLFISLEDLATKSLVPR